MTFKFLLIKFLGFLILQFAHAKEKVEPISGCSFKVRDEIRYARSCREITENTFEITYCDLQTTCSHVGLVNFEKVPCSTRTPGPHISEYQIRFEKKIASSVFGCPFTVKQGGKNATPINKSDLDSEIIKTIYITNLVDSDIKNVTEYIESHCMKEKLADIKTTKVILEGYKTYDVQNQSWVYSIKNRRKECQ